MVTEGGAVLLVICAFIPAGYGLRVYTDREVVGWKDGSVQLNCDFVGNPSLVLWGKVNGSNPSQNVKLAQIREGNITNLTERIYGNEDNSLKIQELKASDEGMYVCETQTMNQSTELRHTQLIVNAFASVPVIQQCGTVYTHQYPRDQPTFCTANATLREMNLDCKLSGFKPNISLEWFRYGSTLQPSSHSTQTSLLDGTYERTVSISVEATHDADQNYTCRAEGVAVNGTASAIITVLALADSPDPSGGGLSAGGIAAIVIICLLLPITIAIGALIAVRKQRHQRLPPYSDEEYHAQDERPATRSGRDAFHKISFFKLRESHSETKPRREPEPDPELVKLMQKETTRVNLRQKIGNYTFTSTENTEFYQRRLHIYLFGQRSAQKSAFINSLLFSYHGEWEEVAPEDDNFSSSDEPIDYPLTDTLALYDSCDLQTFALELLDEVVDTVRGGNQPYKVKESAKKASITKSVALFYQDSNLNTGRDLEFDLKFVVKLAKYYGPKPLFVVPVEDTPELEQFKEKLASCGIPMKNIRHHEYYTKDSHVEDIDVDIKLLRFIKAARDEVCGPRADDDEDDDEAMA